MPLLLKKTPPEAMRWEKIELGPLAGNGEFEVRLKRPTWDDLMADADRYGDQTEFRLKTCVLDWRGVQGEDGVDVPFSWMAFQALCFAYPQVMIQVYDKVHFAYVGLTEDQQKNLPKPSGGESAGTAQIAPQSAETTAEQSKSISDSASSNDLQTPLA